MGGKEGGKDGGREREGWEARKEGCVVMNDLASEVTILRTENDKRGRRERGREGGRVREREGGRVGEREGGRQTGE